MPQIPKCPNCGHPLVVQRIVRAPHPADDQYLFRCLACRLDYVTQDPVPVSG